MCGTLAPPSRGGGGGSGRRGFREGGGGGGGRRRCDAGSGAASSVLPRTGVRGKWRVSAVIGGKRVWLGHGATDERGLVNAPPK